MLRKRIEKMDEQGGQVKRPVAKITNKMNYFCCFWNEDSDCAEILPEEHDTERDNLLPGEGRNS